MTEVSQAPGLDESSLDEARALIGVALRRGDHQWNHYVTPDAVRHFAWGVGDENPMFCDEEYGKGSRWQTGVAPGCFLYSVDSTVVAPRLPGVTWMYAGTDWEWYAPLRQWQGIRSEARLIEAVLKTGTKVGSFIIQTGEVLYFDRDSGDLLAKAISSTFRIPKAKASGGLKYDTRPPYRYTTEELSGIDVAIAAEDVRGADTRYWEDVRVGDALTPVVKGPLTTTDMTCWASTGHFYRAHERAARHRWRHPGDSFRNEETGAADNPARGHAEPGMARDVGMPGVYDGGPQRISWVSHLLTNWMGDDGFLRRLNIKVSRPNVAGDTTWVHGVVTDLDGTHLPALAGDGTRSDVAIDISIVNQMGEKTAGGKAVVSLMRRQESIDTDSESETR